MADEINISLNVDVSSGNFRTSFRPGSISPDMTNVASSVIVQNLTTTITNLSVSPNVVAGGYYWFQNLSTSTSVTFDPSIKVNSCASTSPGTASPFLNLRPGEFALGRCVTTAFSALVVGTSTTELQFGLLSI